MQDSSVLKFVTLCNTGIQVLKASIYYGLVPFYINWYSIWDVVRV